VDLRGQTVFYAGPTPTPPGRASGSIGPTTSVRTPIPRSCYTMGCERSSAKGSAGKPCGRR
jgi:fumarate hydratase subunit beta